MCFGSLVHITEFSAIKCTLIGCGKTELHAQTFVAPQSENTIVGPLSLTDCSVRDEQSVLVKLQ